MILLYLVKLSLVMESVISHICFSIYFECQALLLLLVFILFINPDCVHSYVIFISWMDLFNIFLILGL